MAGNDSKQGGLKVGEGMVEEDNVDMKQLWQNVFDTLNKVRAGELKVKPIRQLYTV